MTYGAVTFEAQAETWHMSVAAVANSISGGIFMQGPGGVIAVPLTQRFGRYATSRQVSSSLSSWRLERIPTSI